MASRCSLAFRSRYTGAPDWRGAAENFAGSMCCWRRARTIEWRPHFEQHTETDDCFAAEESAETVAEPPDRRPAADWRSSAEVRLAARPAERPHSALIAAADERMSDYL